MNEQNKNGGFNIFVVIGLSLLVALVIFIYAKYSGAELTSPNMFGLSKNVEVQQPAEQKTDISEVEEVFNKLIQSYNEQDFALLESVDFRYANNKELEVGKNYVEAIKRCQDFQTHTVGVETVTTTSIKGYFIYSYKIRGSMEEKYVLNSYIVKSHNGKLVITYMETKSNNTENIKRILQEM